MPTGSYTRTHKAKQLTKESCLPTGSYIHTCRSPHPASSAWGGVSISQWVPCKPPPHGSSPDARCANLFWIRIRDPTRGVDPSGAAWVRWVAGRLPQGQACRVCGLWVAAPGSCMQSGCGRPRVMHAVCVSCWSQLAYQNASGGAAVHPTLHPHHAIPPCTTSNHPAPPPSITTQHHHHLAPPPHTHTHHPTQTPSTLHHHPASPPTTLHHHPEPSTTTLHHP